MRRASTLLVACLAFVVLASAVTPRYLNGQEVAGQASNVNQDLSSFFLPGLHDLRVGLRGQYERQPGGTFHGRVTFNWNAAMPPAPGAIFKIYRMSDSAVASDPNLPRGIPVYAFLKHQSGMPLEAWLLSGRRGRPQELSLLLEAHTGKNAPNDVRFFDHEVSGNYLPGLVFVPKDVRPGAYFFNHLREQQFRCGAGQLSPKATFDPLYAYGLSPVYDLGTEALWRAAVKALRRSGVVPMSRSEVSDEEVIPRQWIEQLRALSGRTGGRPYLELRKDVWGNMSCRDMRKPWTCSGDVQEYFWGMCLDWGTSTPFCSFQRWNWVDQDGFKYVATVTDLVTENPATPILARKICSR